MKKTFTLLLLIQSFFLFSYTFAQTKEDFEKIFLKETEGSSSALEKINFKNISTLSYYPDTLPTWFFQPPPSSAHYIYAIGISDPDLTAEDAANQALYRAKTMAILYNRAQIQYFRDVYTVEYTHGRQVRYGQRFDTYFKLSANGFADTSCFAVVNHYFTRFNEALVLVRYTPLDPSKANMNVDLISTVGTALYIEAQIEEAFEPQAEYEFISALRSPSKSTKTALFTYREKGNRFLSISEFQGNTYTHPMFPYRYANPTWQQNTEPLVSYYGLWSIFSKHLLRQLTLETEQSSIKIRSLGEQHNQEHRNLTREVAIKTTKMQINGIEFGNDSIEFEIELFDIK
jgi:hypothetical protein